MLEQARQTHIDIERSTQVITHEIIHQSRCQKRKIYQEHRINDELSQIKTNSAKLLEFYQDVDGSRQREIDGMSGFTLQKTLSSFDERLSEIFSYHEKFPNLSVDDPQIRHDAKLDKIKLVVQPDQLEKIKFSAQEEFGKYLDLNTLYQEFSNMKQFEHTDYLGYVTRFYQFNQFEQKFKNEPYRNYLVHLLDYLRDFYTRARPLDMNVEELEKTVVKQPENGNVDKEDDAEEKTEKTSRKRKRKHNVSKKVQELEALIVKYQEVLEYEIDQTKISIEKKLTRTWEENQLEIEKHDMLEAQEIEKMNQKQVDEDEEVVNDNPLNIPLGYDGKPIPYWLFKLHGLGIEYKCEICGNYGYWGPKAFERHFQEWRHAHAMRCLKIPNTRHFHHITSIQEAMALWKKVKGEMGQGQWDKEQEEYEDRDGNVFSKKTYQDLKRQGLIKE